jgi:hypothetical protein
MIERGQLRLAKPFHDGEDGRAHEPDVRVGVAVAQLTNTTVVLGDKVLHTIGTGYDVVE